MRRDGKEKERERKSRREKKREIDGSDELRHLVAYLSMVEYV